MLITTRTDIPNERLTATIPGRERLPEDSARRLRPTTLQDDYRNVARSLSNHYTSAPSSCVPLLNHLPLVLRTLLLTAIMEHVLTYVVMP